MSRHLKEYRQHITSIALIIAVFALTQPFWLCGAPSAHAAEPLSPLERAVRQKRDNSVQTMRDPTANAKAAAKAAEDSAKVARDAVKEIRKLKETIEELLRERRHYRAQPTIPETVPHPKQTAKPAQASEGRFQFAQWAEGSSSYDGATREFFDRAAHLKWRKRLGDWIDSQGVLYGDMAYAAAEVEDLDREQTITWDITRLVKGWRDGEYPNTGVFLRVLVKRGGGTIVFFSRDHLQVSKSPILRISYAGVPRKILKPTADTYLESSTYRSLGKNNILKVGRGPSTLIRFDDKALRELGPFVKAELLLHTTSNQYHRSVVGVFRPAPGVTAARKAATPGIADRYPNDDGIKADKNVMFAENFNSANWRKSWSSLGSSKSYQLVGSDKVREFVPLSGTALRVVITQGSKLGLNLRYKFAAKNMKEPEAAYFRYYLRLSSDWRPTIQGGKLPGFAGTYHSAGWGGRRSNGTNGWSTRGQFNRIIPKGSPLHGRLPIGTYAYHADMKGKFGDAWMWNNGGLGFLKNNQWYCIEQYVKLNKVGKRDGVFKAWIDGQLAYSRNNIRYRSSSKLKIEEVWMNVYHGGTQPAPQDYSLYIDNVVIARSYIGQLKR